MDRITRKKLKTDKFAEDVGSIWDFVTEHQSEVTKYGALAVAVLLIAGGIYFYMRHETTVREAALTNAMNIDAAVNSGKVQPPFKTLDDQQKGLTQAYTDLATKYRGSLEGSIGALYLADADVDKGDLTAAAKIYQEVVDSGSKDYASIARLALAHLDAAQGKIQDAKSQIQYVIDHPTALVSKDQAILEMADIVGKTDPAQARKMLEPLRTSRTAISRVAVDEMGKLPVTN